jgi:pyridoxine 5-phosphate synthase
VRLQVNVDHVATLRQARGTPYPDPVVVALACERAGAHGITVHLREDRRHIQDHDVERMRAAITTLLNLEMAATPEMVDIALRVRPDLVTLVPERRQERTTEGGLDVAGQREALSPLIDRLRAAKIPVSLFIAGDPRQIDASIALRAEAIELHTGELAHATLPGAPAGKAEDELAALAAAARHARERSASLRLAAGHGLTVANVPRLLAAVPQIEELNIGHALVADAVLVGIEGAVRAFLSAMGARP